MHVIYIRPVNRGHAVEEEVDWQNSVGSALLVMMSATAEDHNSHITEEATAGVRTFITLQSELSRRQSFGFSKTKGKGAMSSYHK